MNGKDRRKRENEYLIRRMRSGDNLCHTGLSAFRWAPRPIIKKDKAAVERLYKGETK